MLTVCLGLLTFEACSPTARADSFNITNILVPGTVAGFPTNVPTSGGIGQGTGGGVSLANNAMAGFYFTGLPIITNGGTDTIQFTLVRSGVSSPPGVTYGTNNWSANNPVLLASDWETYSNQVVPLVFTIPVNGTNAIHWWTNIPDAWVYSAQWIGVGQIVTTGCTITNAAAGVAKKIVPTRWP